jgi:hypothetical protein
MLAAATSDVVTVKLHIATVGIPDNNDSCRTKPVE